MSKTEFGRKFGKSLKRQLGKHKVVFMNGHTHRHRGWPGGAPRAVFLHWTAGAATSSDDPGHPGNQRGANSGVVAWCHHPSSPYPYCNITLDRDGTCYINTAHGSAWHSGEGSFRGTRFSRLGIGDNAAHLYTLGVEIVDKGTSDGSITKAQWEAVSAICVAAREAAGWKGFKYRITNHHTWAPTRKVDIDTRYSMDNIHDRAVAAWKRRHR